jgi:type IV pilus assembly protein PilO
MNKVIDNIVKMPIATKLAVVLLAAALLTGGNYFLTISALDDKIKSSQGQIGKLEKDLVDKKVIADNLNQFKRDKEVLERRLAEALTELPIERDIDELLRQLNDVGKKSGLEIVSLEPGKETPQNFYASIPIKMQVSGSYHEIAVFFESVSKLRRIVNISNISLANPTRRAEKVILTSNYLATTFRFLEKGAAADAKAASAGKGKGKR